MKILIVGAKGMLGQELATVFSDSTLILWDKNDLDITNGEVVEKKIEELRPELIINSAAYNNVDACETNFELAKAVNGDGPINLAKAAEKVEATFIHYSTDYVFEGTKESGYNEDDQPAPISKYGESKLFGERVLDYCKRCYVIRTSRLYGLPAVSDGAKKSFVDVMLKLAEDKDSLEVVDEEFSNPTYVVDLALKTRELFDGKLPHGLYHVVNEGACTWYEFATEIFKLADKGVTIKPVASTVYNRPAKRPKYSSLINNKLPKLRNWREALAAYLIQREKTL